MPTHTMRPTRENVIQYAQIGMHMQVAVEQLLTVVQGQRSQKLTWAALQRLVY